MKRSEMLSKIASVIINYNEAHCIINRDKAMEMAETILQVQEKLGMIGPKDAGFELYYARELGYETYDDYLVCSIYEPRGGWEPENEKK